MTRKTINTSKMWYGVRLAALFTVCLLFTVSEAGSQAKSNKKAKVVVPAIPDQPATVIARDVDLYGLDAMRMNLDRVEMAPIEAAAALDRMRSELAGSAFGITGDLLGEQVEPFAEAMALKADLASAQVSAAPMALAHAQAEMALTNVGVAQSVAPVLADQDFFGVQDVSGSQQSAAQEAYQKAYNLILDKNWAEAQKQLDAFINKYPRNSNATAARYWKCYTREKLGDPAEEVFRSYQQFVERYGQSRWADDARTNMIRIGSALAKQGKSEYADIVKSMQEGEDEEVKLTALYALRNSSDEKALPVIMDLYDKSKSERMREKIVYVLGGFDSPLVVPKLADIAVKDPSTRVQKSAVYALGNTKKGEAVDALKKIVKSQSDPDIRTTALYSLANLGDEDVVPFLTDIAVNESDARLAKAATYSVSNINRDESTKALQTILKGAKLMEVRKAALQGLANHADDNSVALLKQVALSKGDKEEDPGMQRTAVYALGNIRTPASTAALKVILESAVDVRTKEAALQSIGQRGDEDARDILKKYALSSQDDRLARTAIYSLGSSRAAKDTSFYLDILRNAKSVEVRKAALYQLANNAGPGAVSVLGKIIKEEKDEDLKISAIYVLGNLKNDEAVGMLLNVAQTDGMKRARTAAVSALSNIGTPKAQDALVQILEGKSKNQ